MGKKKKLTSPEDLVVKIEKILDTEIDSLPSSLSELPPEKRIEFIRYTLPLVIKYREDHTPGGIGLDWCKI